MSEDEKRAFVITDDAPGKLSEWDFDSIFSEHT
jgi:hypothetical protein